MGDALWTYLVATPGYRVLSAVVSVVVGLLHGLSFRDKVEQWRLGLRVVVVIWGFSLICAVSWSEVTMYLSRAQKKWSTDM